MNSQPTMTDWEHRIRGRLTALGICFVLLFALTLWAGIRSGRDKHSGIDLQMSDIISPDVDIASIGIQAFGSQLTVLSYTGTQWLVASGNDMTEGAQHSEADASSNINWHIARGDRINAMLDELFALRFLRRVSSGAGLNQSIDADVNYHLLLYDRHHRLISDIALSTAYTELGEQLIDIDGQQSYAVSADMGFYLSQPIQYWTELRVWNMDFDASSVALRVVREYSDGFSQSWQRSSDGSWESGGHAVDDQSANSIEEALREFRLLEGMELLPEHALDGLEPKFQFTVEFQGARSLSAMFYQGTQGWILKPLEGPDYRSASGRPRLYKISENQLNQFMSF